MPPTTFRLRTREELSTGAILGIVFGVLGGLCVIGLLYGFLKKPNKLDEVEAKKKEEQKAKDTAQQALHESGAPVGPATVSQIGNLVDNMPKDVGVNSITKQMPLDNIGVNSITKQMPLDDIGATKLSQNMVLDNVNIKSTHSCTKLTQPTELR
jgi:hypothetical protein